MTNESAGLVLGEQLHQCPHKRVPGCLFYGGREDNSLVKVNNKKEEMMERAGEGHARF